MELMTTARTLQDQELMAESEILCLQNGAGSETIAQREKQGQHGPRRLPVAAPQMQQFQCVRSFWQGQPA
jgi:hypothetical protein